MEKIKKTFMQKIFFCAVLKPSLLCEAVFKIVFLLHIFGILL